MFVKRIVSIYIVLFLFVSCGQKQSITNFSDVYIYSSEEDKYLIQDVIENFLFNFTFHTPSPQKRYNPIWKTDLDFINQPKNSQLMLISIEDPQDSTIDIIANHLLSNSKHEEHMILINDYFFKDQNLFILKYPNQAEMIADIYDRKNWILEELKKNDTKKIKDYSFRSGINEDVIMTLDSLFSITMHIQKDYEIIKQSKKENFLWIGRSYPYRWILIYEDNINFYDNPEETWSRFEDKFNDILNVDIIPYETQFDKVLVGNRKNKKLYGIFGTKIDSGNPTGGPFISYIFESEKTSRALIAVGFVNFPGENKVFHIKELEYIIETIKIDERKMGYE
tara:strand:+ start:645 stop:1655 length:1011 start_codon:yes stop_codon:yes gene_type:complete